MWKFWDTPSLGLGAFESEVMFHSVHVKLFSGTLQTLRGATAAVASSSPTATPTSTPDYRAMPAPAARLPIPDADALKKADALIKDVFKEDIAAAKKHENKLLFVQRLMVQALESGTDAAARYAMLMTARDTAVELGNATLLSRISDTLAREYEVDGTLLLADALVESSKRGHPAAIAKALAEAALQHAGDAADAESFEPARRFSTAATTSARLAKDTALSKQVLDRTKEIDAARTQWEAVQKAYTTLEEKPDDSTANLTVGRDLCFNRGEWDKGLPHLAKGTDKILADLATASLAGAKTPDEQAAIGDAWWTAAEKATATARKVDLQGGARHWYELALPGLSSLAKTKVEKRLAEAAKGPAPKMKTTGYVSLFNGRDLSGWKVPAGDNGQWSVVNGAIVGVASGMTYLITDRDNYQDFHLRAEIMVNDGGNGGLHGRTPAGQGGGYEAQVNANSNDPRTTGSLYIGAGTPPIPVTQPPPPPGTWFTMELIVRGNRIGVMVNGRPVMDYVDDKNSHVRGHLALEGGRPNSIVYYRKIEVRELPTSQ
jgi:hypothetical protein